MVPLLPPCSQALRCSWASPRPRRSYLALQPLDRLTANQGE
jgi:hypothetical protein